MRKPVDAETTRPLAFNQGFYNLFLAVAAFLGVVLVFSDRTKLRAAATQGTAPLLAVIALTVWML